MKLRIAEFVGVAAVAAPAGAIAHPGNHDAIAMTDMGVHISTSMFHLGLFVIGLAAIMVAVKAVSNRRTSAQHITKRIRNSH